MSVITDVQSAVSSNASDSQRECPMANSTRLRRLLQLVALLQTGPALNAEALSLRLKVTRRTIFRDLQTLNDAGLTTFFDEDRQGYFLPSPWRLPAQPLNAAEALSLLLICQEMGRPDRGMPFHAAARSAALKISQTLPPALQDFAQEAVEGISIHLEARNPLTSAAGHYEALLEAWMQRRQCRIEYDSATDRQRLSTLLSPYRLLFSRRSWYVIGRSSRDREIRTFNIGRIVSIQLLDGAYRIPKWFHLDKYLGDAWHLIREHGQRHEVVIHFQPLVARNVAEVQWHRTQKCRWLDDGSLEFQVTVEGLSEITWWILGYGDSARVLAPEELVQRLRDRIAAMARRYEEC